VFGFLHKHPTVCVTRKWAGLDSVWEQKKLEARKVPVKRAESHLSGARCVSQRALTELTRRRRNCLGVEMKTWLARFYRQKICSNYDTTAGKLPPPI